jgi:hypothetical protein
MRRLAHDVLEECDRVLRHQLEGDRPVDVRGTAVSAPFGGEHMEVLCQSREVRAPRPRVDSRPAGVQQYERLALT